jgi:hypothetical protein
MMIAYVIYCNKYSFRKSNIFVIFLTPNIGVERFRLEISAGEGYTDIFFRAFTLRLQADIKIKP